MFTFLEESVGPITFTNYIVSRGALVGNKTIIYTPIDSSMKILLISILMIFFSINGMCQAKTAQFSDNCSYVLDAVSYFWKLDSLGSNGFRLYAYERIMKCKMDKISLSYVLDKFGKPNMVRKDDSGVYYCYFYYDGNTIPKEANKTRERLFIFFKLNATSPYVAAIGTDQIEN
jgi:hypothetical protein